MVAALVLGALTPRRHTSLVSCRIKAAPSEIVAMLVDVASWPRWHRAVAKVERAPDVDGHAVWRVTDPRGRTIPYAITSSEHCIVTRLVDDDLPFGGTWTWSVTPADGGADVTIVETGVIKNPVFRAVSRVAFGYTTTQKIALAGLAAKLGDTAALTESWRYVDDAAP